MSTLEKLYLFFRIFTLLEALALVILIFYNGLLFPLSTPFSITGIVLILALFENVVGIVKKPRTKRLALVYTLFSSIVLLFAFVLLIYLLSDLIRLPNMCALLRSGRVHAWRNDRLDLLERNLFYCNVHHPLIALRMLSLFV
jgi:hypothetical protein